MGCGDAASAQDAGEKSATEPAVGANAEDEAAQVDETVNEPQVEEDTSMHIQVTVNGVAFVATLDEGPAGQALLSRLPLTLTMDELHGNEKYCYTGEAFGGDSFVPGTIEAGDLMVFGSDCLVLFYETFANDGWSYQRVGKIDDASGLADACGAGQAVVEFAAFA